MPEKIIRQKQTREEADVRIVEERVHVTLNIEDKDLAKLLLINHKNDFHIIRAINLAMDNTGSRTLLLSTLDNAVSRAPITPQRRKITPSSQPSQS